MNLSTISLALTRLGWMFSPAALFAAGEQGVWYDPSDLTTLFQDSAGTIPVTAVQQPVGLMLDKSKGLVLGPELVTNGEFATNLSGWTHGADWSWSFGSAKHTAGTATSLLQTVGNVGKIYKVQFDVINRTAGSGTVYIGNGTYSAPFSGNGTYSMIGTMAVTGRIEFLTSSTFDGSIDNVSVKELSGNHAFQTTSASRPVLSARYNLLTKTEQFDDGVWTKSGLNAFGSGSVANTTATTDPLGGNTADYIQESTATSDHGVSQSVSSNNGVFIVYAKAAQRTRIGIACPGTVNKGNVFDLSAQAIQNFASVFSAADAASITSIGNGWFRCSITISTAVTRADVYILNAGTDRSYTGDGTSGIYIWGADLRVSNDAIGQPAYQRVNTSTDYDTVGFKPYLAFDGVDDSLVTNSIDFTGTDKMTVFAGVRKLNDTTGGVVYETATGSGIGAFYAYAGTASTATGPNWTFGSRGTGNGFVQSSGTYAAPLTNVITGTGDISGGTVVLRANGTSTGSQFGDQGTGNYGNYPFYIGRRANSSLPFNGRMYSLIVRGAASTTAQITSTETWVNQRTGAYT